MSKKNKKPEVKIENEIKSLREQLARALADYDNLQKRIVRQQEESEDKIKAQIIMQFLPIIDMLENVQMHLNDSGLAMVLKEFEGKFKEEGLMPIKPEKGQKFDENLHEAIEAVYDESQKKGTIVKLSLTGYKINDYIIRPAKVVVAKGEK